MPRKIDRAVVVAGVGVGDLAIGAIRAGNTSAGALEALHIGAAVQSVGAPAAAPVDPAGCADALHTLQPAAAAHLFGTGAVQGARGGADLRLAAHSRLTEETEHALGATKTRA